MVKRKGKTREKPPNWYPLSEVRNLINKGKYLITANARDSAYRDFGWHSDDIVNAIKKLSPKHFYKTEISKRDSSKAVEVYKARGLNGENIYTHFYIDDEQKLLIINSFKKL